MLVQVLRPQIKLSGLQYRKRIHVWNGSIAHGRTGAGLPIRQSNWVGTRHSRLLGHGWSKPLHVGVSGQNLELELHK